MKYHLMLVLVFISTISVTAQKKISLTPEPLAVAETYHFNNITIADSRIDTTILGRVVKGISGVNETLSPLKLKGANIPSFEEFYAGCTQQLTKGTQDIFIHITDIFLDEDPQTGAFGTVDLRAEVYAIKDGLYYNINTFDRTEVVTAFDATKKMIRDLNTSLKNLLEYANNFFKPDVFTKKGLTLEEVMQAKNGEKKQKYPVYASTASQDGIYGTFQEFLENKPGRPAASLEGLIAKNLDKPKRKREALFGYCKDGNCFIFQGNKYDTSGIYRRDGEIYMQNYGIDPEKQADQNALSWLSPLALLMNTDSWYEYMLNPRMGTWYQMKKLGTRKRPETETAVPAAEGEGG